MGVSLDRMEKAEQNIRDLERKIRELRRELQQESLRRVEIGTRVCRIEKAEMIAKWIKDLQLSPEAVKRIMSDVWDHENSQKPTF